jgi:hypothetical protein
MKKVLLSGFFLTTFLFACHPICNHEHSTYSQNQRFIFLIDEKTNEIIEKINNIHAKQEELKTVLKAKIKLLTQIKSVLIQILLMKEKENFYLKKILTSMEYDNGKLIHK